MTRRRWFCFCRGSALRFFWLRRIGMMADHRHHGEGEHYHRYVAMPAMPGSALVVIEPELVFGGLKNYPRSPSDGLRPRPAFQWLFLLGPRWARRGGHHLRCDAGS